MVKSEDGCYTRVFIGRRPTSVMRKESRGCGSEETCAHGFGWSNLMEIASVLETI
jgi:hypothetical protein